MNTTNKLGQDVEAFLASIAFLKGMSGNLTRWVIGTVIESNFPGNPFGKGIGLYNVDALLGRTNAACVWAAYNGQEIVTDDGGGTNGPAHGFRHFDTAEWFRNEEGHIIVHLERDDGLFCHVRIMTDVEAMRHMSKLLAEKKARASAGKEAQPR